MVNQFIKAFSEYVCEGDTISAEIDGFQVTARIVRDGGFWPSRNPTDAGYIGENPSETYEKQMARAHKIMNAWANDDWFYCGVVLSVSKAVKIKGRAQEEVIISGDAAGLWGIECNYPDSKNEYLTEAANEMLDEALNHARECLKQISGVKG